jgi:hypothetical protein
MLVSCHLKKTHQLSSVLCRSTEARGRYREVSCSGEYNSSRVTLGVEVGLISVASAQCYNYMPLYIYPSLNYLYLLNIFEGMNLQVSAITRLVGVSRTQG